MPLPFLAFYLYFKAEICQSDVEENNIKVNRIMARKYIKKEPTLKEDSIKAVFSFKKIAAMNRILHSLPLFKASTY